ncbi:MAG: bifunctional transaldolase/phosoglucose isomerase [Acidobacteriota bacterium]
MLNRIAVTLSEGLKAEVVSVIDEWRQSDKVERIWKRDASVWTGKDEAKWLGWLDIVDEELGGLEKYRAFRADIESSGFKDVLLMGMGGSSLCPEVLGFTFNKPNFHILDSTDPARVKAIESLIDIDKTLFIVASKSGSTLEPNCFKQYFFDKVSQTAGKENAGKQFVAITDPGSKMEKIAVDDGFRHIFYGEPEIGGRFSALSAFGLAAAAAMGLDVEPLLQRSKEMVDACKSDDNENSGLLLGAIMGICQTQGRDKITFFCGDEIHDLGAWLEQLIAESTGKNGKAIIPVDREPIQRLEDYGGDRIFVHLTVRGGKTSREIDERVEALKRSDHPFISIELDSVENIGQEFFRWEFATAVAGSIMEINPFDQPDVEAAKIEARKLTDEYEKEGKLPDEKPFFESEGISLFSSDEYADKLQGAAGDNTLAGLIRAHLDKISSGDYFALLAYIEMSDENVQLLQQIREGVLDSKHVATCLGFGPRFLHSTGQAYKGGPNSGVFLQITADDDFDIPVPGQKYTFGVVKAAQARGDFQVLLDRERRALRVHIAESLSVKDGLKRLLKLITE